MSHKNCTCRDCGSDASEMSYMYRNLKGKSVFTGFVTKNKMIIWVGKNEAGMRPIVSEEDRQFFLSEMRQYD